MAHVQQRHKSSKVCPICGKLEKTTLNRPHSLKRTKKLVKPNFQVKFGLEACQNCFRTLKKKGLKLSN